MKNQFIIPKGTTILLDEYLKDNFITTSKIIDFLLKTEARDEFYYFEDWLDHDDHLCWGDFTRKATIKEIPKLAKAIDDGSCLCLSMYSIDFSWFVRVHLYDDDTESISISSNNETIFRLIEKLKLKVDFSFDTKEYFSRYTYLANSRFLEY